MSDITAVSAGTMVNQSNVDNQIRKKEINSTDTTAPSNEELGQLQQAIAGVVSMQAISMLSKTSAETNNAMTKPTQMAQELKKEEQEEQRKREDEDNF